MILGGISTFWAGIDWQLRCQATDQTAHIPLWGALEWKGECLDEIMRITKNMNE